MGLFKYIERINLINTMIESECTGRSWAFAKRIGISRSLLMEHLKELREVYNAPIAFCRKRQTFYYKETFTLQIVVTTGLDKVAGGIGCISFSPTESDSTRLYLNCVATQKTSLSKFR